jgi:hypothetical protein
MAQRNNSSEIFAINSYCKTYNAKILGQPDPPDAIIQYENGKISWLEIRTIWRGEHRNNHTALAKALTSHNPIAPLLGVNFSKSSHLLNKDLIYAINHKDNNPQYLEFVNKYGKGTLILSLESPCYGSDDLSSISLPLDENKFLSFKQVLLYITPIHVWREGTFSSFSKLIPIHFLQQGDLPEPTTM